MNILVADDNEHNRYIASFLLERAEHTVTKVENGEDAVRAATQNDFDLILMDIQMPGMDGIEATNKIKAAGITTPVVAMTARAMHTDREEILAAGCDGYIPKPFKVEDFIDQVDKFLSGEY